MNLFLYFSSFFCLSNWQRLKTCICKIVSAYLWWLQPGICELCSLSAVSSFFFLSNFQALKCSVTFFSRTVRPRRLKLGTHVDSRQMYCVYRNRAAALIGPFISSFFFLSNFQTLKYFVTLFSGTMRPRRLKLGTQVDSWQMYLVYQNQAAAAAYSSLYFFIFLCLKFSNIKFFVTHFSGTVRPGRLKLMVHNFFF